MRDITSYIEGSTPPRACLFAYAGAAVYRPRLCEIDEGLDDERPGKGAGRLALLGVAR